MKLLRAILFLIATLVIYLGWSLLGWGLSGLGDYFSSAPRTGYAIVVLVFGFAIGIQAYSSIEGIRGKKGAAGKLVSRQTVVRYVLELSLYLALFFIPFFDRHAIGVYKASDLLRWLGVISCLLGYGLIYWSGVALGRQYSADVTIQVNHHLITDSIYRYIRHPRYLGILALSIGISLAFRSWIGLLATLFFLALLLYRIKDEEATMQQEFGTEWDAYCQCTWRLIPYLY